MVLVHPARTAPLALLGSDCQPGTGTEAPHQAIPISLGYSSSTERWRGCMYRLYNVKGLGSMGCNSCWVNWRFVLPVSGCPPDR